MQARRLAAYAVAIALLGGALVLARRALVSGVGRAQARVSEATRELTFEPESVMAGATYQHFRERRQAVTLMQADLRKWAVAESAYIADSGHPGGYIPLYDSTLAKGNDPVVFTGPFFLGPGGWLGAHHAGVTCWVYVGLDTTMSQRPSGQPACAGDRAVPPRIARALRGEH